MAMSSLVYLSRECLKWNVYQILTLSTCNVVFLVLNNGAREVGSVCNGYTPKSFFVKFVKSVFLTKSIKTRFAPDTYTYVYVHETKLYSI